MGALIQALRIRTCLSSTFRSKVPSLSIPAWTAARYRRLATIIHPPQRFRRPPKNHTISNVDLTEMAERKSSLGKDWHRECLSCEECGKVLHPGQHAQHKGVPYCHVPCYSALFGPTMFGHGSAVDAHANFGNQASKINSPVRKPDLQAKLRGYNDYYEGKNLHIKSKEVNGRLVLEGPLRVHWGVESPIHLKEKDESPISRESLKEWRRSYCLAIDNGLDNDFLMKKSQRSQSMKWATPVIPRPWEKSMDNGGETLKPRRGSMEDLLSLISHSGPEQNGAEEEEEKTVKYSTVAVRGGRRKKDRSKRLSIINGHLYNAETSIFTPVHGSITSVTISSLDTTTEVLKLMLEKFKVENDPTDFCLCTVRKSGEVKVLQDDRFPLLERVMLGPLEDDAKIFIMDKDLVSDVNEEVAHFVNLPEAVLAGFLEKLKKEEEMEESGLRKRYGKYKREVESRLSEFHSTQL